MTRPTDEERIKYLKKLRHLVDKESIEVMNNMRYPVEDTDTIAYGKRLHKLIKEFLRLNREIGQLEKGE